MFELEEKIKVQINHVKETLEFDPYDELATGQLEAYEDVLTMIRGEGVWEEAKRTSDRIMCEIGELLSELQEVSAKEAVEKYG